MSRGLRTEVFVAFEAQREVRQQIGRPIDVRQRDHFDRAVHVAIRNADQARRHAAAADLDGVGVGAGGPSAGGQLVRRVSW